MVTRTTTPSRCAVVACPADGGSFVLSVDGELDCTASARLRLHGLSVLSPHPPTVLRLAMGHVTFIDCAGLGALYDVAGAAAVNGVPLVLESVSRPVRHLIELCGSAPAGLDGLLPRRPLSV